MKTNNTPEVEKIRLSKYVALAHGISRHKAEVLISAGNVLIDGTPVLNPTIMIPSDIKDVTINKERVVLAKKPKETSVIVMHKPAGYVVTRSDEKDRATIYNLLPPKYKNYIYIGRLDLNSEGLLMLTNDGDLSQFFERPVNAIEREYKVRIKGILDEKKLYRIQKGVIIDGISYRPKDVWTIKKKTAESANCWIGITLVTGKNREVRKLMDHFGLTVSRLVRVRYGNIKLGALDKGAWYELDKHTVDTIKKKYQIT